MAPGYLQVDHNRRQMRWRRANLSPGPNWGRSTGGWSSDERGNWRTSNAMAPDHTGSPSGAGVDGERRGDRPRVLPFANHSISPALGPIGAVALFRPEGPPQHFRTRAWRP